MSVSVTYEARATAVETLDNNPDSAAASKRQVTHGQFDQTAKLDAASTPPATKVAEFKLTLTAGMMGGKGPYQFSGG